MIVYLVHLGIYHHIMNNHYMFDYVYFKLRSDKAIENEKFIPNAMELLYQQNGIVMHIIFNTYVHIMPIG